MAKTKTETAAAKKAAKPAPKPLRTTLAALGIGMAWGVSHMPEFQGVTPGLVVWLVESLVAAVLAKAVLDIAGGLLSWCVRSMQSLTFGEARE